MATEEFEITIEIVCTELPGAGQSSFHLGIQRDTAITEAASAIRNESCSSLRYGPGAMPMGPSTFWVRLLKGRRPNALSI
jgi:hypothetical protein